MVMFGIAAGLLYLTYLWDRKHENSPLLWVITVIAETIVVIHTLGVWATLVGYRNDVPEPTDVGAVRRDLLVGTHPMPSVDVFICHASESLDLLLPTMIAARDMLLPHRTWVLDDGRNPNVRAACIRLGIGYLVRPNRDHAKAGNINAAFARTNGEYVAMFDADHVPRPDFLVQTLPHLIVNPAVAMVQTPQTYRTAGRGKIAEGAAVSQELFYQAIMPAKSMSNAAICVGTNVVFRRGALESLRFREETARERREAGRLGHPRQSRRLTALGEEFPAGGVWTGSNSEDVWTSLELQRRGWRTTYLPRVVSQGLTPDTLPAFLKQQFRWASGGWEVVMRGRIFRDHRLTISQKLQYLMIATHYLLSLSVMMVATLSPIYLLTDKSPVTSPVVTWAVHFVPFTIIALLVTFVQAGKFEPSATAISLVAAPAQFKAFFSVLFGVRSGWVVTNARQRGSIVTVMLPHLVLAGIDIVAIVFGWLIGGQDRTSVVIATAFCLLHAGLVAYQFRAALNGRRLAENPEPTDEEALDELDAYLSSIPSTPTRSGRPFAAEEAFS